MKKQIKLTIPSLFPSVNDQYRTARVGRSRVPMVYLTQEARQYRNEVQWAAKFAYKGKPIEGNVRVDVKYYFPNKRRRDLLNDKLTWDSCEGYFYNDDKQIVEAHLYKCFDKDKPRTEITITEL